MNPYLSTSRNPGPLPPPDILRSQIDEAVRWVKEHVGAEDDDGKDIESVQMFHPTSPGNVKGFKGKNFPQRTWVHALYRVFHCDPTETSMAGFVLFRSFSIMVHQSPNDRVLRDARYREQDQSSTARSSEEQTEIGTGFSGSLGRRRRRS